MSAIKATMPLEQVCNLTKEEAAALFTRPRKYDHLGVTISETPVWILFNKLRSSDDANLNVGRQKGHTPQEKESLQRSFAKDVQLWQELPMASRCKEPEFLEKFTHNLRVGFGRRNAIGANGKDGYWFWEIKGTTTQLEDCQAFENTDNLLTTQFQLGEKGVENRLKKLISDGLLEDDSEEIESKLDQVWPGLDNPARGRILKAVETDTTTPKRYKTYNQEDVKIWLTELASSEYKFVLGGNLDTEKDMWGFSSVNFQDPYINATRKFVATGKKSYVVFSVKSPTKNSDLAVKRQNLLNSLKNFHEVFKKAGVKECSIEVLGFMPQDNIKEDMRCLVDVEGLPMSLETIKIN